MKLRSFDAPESDAELAAWLEGELVGCHLAELVAELEAASDSKASDSALTLEAVLEDRIEAVFSNGLSELPPAQLRKLFRQPALLFDLQEAVLIKGGPYWRQLEMQAVADGAIESGWAQLVAGLTSHSGDSTEKSAIQEEPAATTEKPKPPLRLIWGAVAIAASLLLVVSLINMGRDPGGAATTAGWGWAKSGALDVDLTEPEYLNHLADQAETWFKKRPLEREPLAKRINEFRQGCEALIAAPHSPLSDANREWLVERCRAWEEKLAGHVQLLDEPNASPDDVRDLADDTINKLIQAIRGRAAEATA